MYPRYVPLLHCFTYLICMCTYCVLIQLYCNQIWDCLHLTPYRHSFLLLCICLVSLYSALSKNSSHLIPLQSRYFSTVPRHLSHRRERSFPFPVGISPCPTLSAVVSQLCPPRDRLNIPHRVNVNPSKIHETQCENGAETKQANSLARQRLALLLHPKSVARVFTRPM